MDKDQALKELKEIKARAKALEDIINAPEKWEPEGGPHWVTALGAIVDEGKSIPTYRAAGVEFKNRTEAEEAAKYYRFIHRLYKLAEEMNEKYPADLSCKVRQVMPVTWDKRTAEWKYYIASPNYLDKLMPYFLSPTSAMEAVNIMNSDPDWKYWEE